ncbi:hypothetical protein [Actinacidiphila sp. bgisy160]|uniref:hypothetical protein n=1 Tax=Actinacidiphila sp. bgisy160 TaxID=3413796 RepID=UPI003D725BB8
MVPVRHLTAAVAEREVFHREAGPRDVWGAHDEFYAPAGDRPFLGDLPEAEVHLPGTGHFALESTWTPSPGTCAASSAVSCREPVVRRTVSGAG